MDLAFGHGFIPRIGGQNYKAIDRSIGPDSLFDSPVSLPWAILEGPWVGRNPDFVASLQAHGTRVIVDDAGWRYRYRATFDVASMVSTRWAPDVPLHHDEPEPHARYVRASLRAQARLGADAYLVPGFFPLDRHEDLRPVYERVLTVVASFDEVEPRPLILFVGAHTLGWVRRERSLTSYPAT